MTRWVFVVGYALVLLVILGLQGIMLDKEAAKYIGCAEEVLHGDVHDLFGNYLKYSAYILFLTPFVAMGVPAAAVLAQIAMMILGSLALGRLVTRLTNETALGNLTLGIFLLCPMVQSWTLTLYTEAFYTSASILFLERVTRTGSPGLDGLGFSLATLFARPVGMFMVVVTALWKITSGQERAVAILIRSICCSALLVGAIFLPGIRSAQLLPIASGEVIAGDGGIRIDTADVQGSRIIDAQISLSKHLSVAEWGTLTTQRMASLFTLTRMHYSALHNLLNAAFYLLYPFALIGAWMFRKKPTVQVILVTILLNTILIGVTHDEWNGRFTVPLLPWVMLLTGLGIASVLQSTKSLQRQEAP